jgi:hypothetical protein
MAVLMRAALSSITPLVATLLAGLPPEAKPLAFMVSDQQSASAGVTLKQLAENSFLVRPGVSEDDPKFLRGQSKLFMCCRFRCREPSE